MERVTDEWLKQVALAAYDSSGCESISDDTEAMIALHRAVSQAVARECEEVFRLNTHPDEFLANLRARFGLKD